MTDTLRLLIAGNWKMNGLKADGIALAHDLCDLMAGAPASSCEFVICPPATLLAPVAEVLRGKTGIDLGAQDCHAAVSGAHTGDISAAMLADLGCRYVILGHSERRADHGETDEVVREKAEAARSSGLNAIICVGETEAQRDQGKALGVVGAQLKGSLPAASTAGNTTIAYEPVWAIGTGRTPTSGQIAEMHDHIRSELASIAGQLEADRMRLLYGGSVKPGNAREILAIDNVDGALVGGASLTSEDFWAIGQSCP